MCVIIAKNKDKRLPTKEELKNCFESNPDGAGFMYVDNNNVIIDKGYMDYKSFIKHFEKLCKKHNDFKNKSLVIHCRITTDGSTSQKNCHPFPICESIKEMQKTKSISNLGVAHNGIITDFRPDKNGADISDTILFIKNYLAPIKKSFFDFYKNQAFLDGVELITSSKFAFLDSNENLVTCGNFTDENGVLFSNNSFIDYRKYYNYGTNYGYNYDFYDDYNFEEIDTIRDKDYLIELKNDYFVEIPNENDFDDYSFDFLSIEEIKVDDNSKCFYNPFSYSIIEIDENGVELQKINYVNAYDNNYALIF